MGLETELKFRKGRGEGFSPNTVLPSPRHCLDAEKRNVKGKGKPARKDNRLSLKEDFREISFGRYRSSSCKNVPSRPLVGLEGNIQLRRGSIYQSTREVGNLKKRGSVEERRKIEVPCSSSNSAFSFRVVDTLCSSDEESQQERSSVMSQNSNFSAASVSRPYVEPCSSDDFFEICLDSSNQEKSSAGNEVVERMSLHKSLSANVGMSRLPSLTENDCAFRASSKARFSPIRKMFMKPKPVQSPLSDIVEVSKVEESGITNNKTNKRIPKSLLDDFSTAPDLEVNNPQIATRGCQHSLLAGSPVHLHGSLKLENKDGMPYFEFSLKYPEEVLVAKTWKADKALNWIYTFHSIDGRKRSNVSLRGSNYSNKESLIVGQMHVSCSVCSELRDERALDNSMVTEFVSYDIAHARKSVAAQDLSNCSPDVNKSGKGLIGRFALGNEPDLAKVNPQPKQVIDNRELDSSYHCPWDPSDLHPNLEIAATVIQVPFEKRESLKYKRGDKICDKMKSNLLKLSKIGPKARVTDGSSPAKVKVIIPSGNHGLPSDESQGPSSLLERWRLGGGCDCGGWDMACPLVVFGNPELRSGEDHLLVENHHPLELFVQGSKENAPALTLTFIEEGEYAVDFHAQLSTLQAFSICVAILHGTEASSAAGHERNMQLPQSSPLKILINEEVKFLIEAVTEEEKRKLTKTRKEIPASFVLNPPFSPIARV